MPHRGPPLLALSPEPGSREIQDSLRCRHSLLDSGRNMKPQPQRGHNADANTDAAVVGFLRLGVKENREEAHGQWQAGRSVHRVPGNEFP